MQSVFLVYKWRIELHYELTCQQNHTYKTAIIFSSTDMIVALMFQFRDKFSLNNPMVIISLLSTSFVQNILNQFWET